MFKIKRVEIALFAILLHSINFAQVTTNLNGIVNIYTAVSAINTATVTVASSAGIAVGDRVLIIQMKGATINTSNSSSYGTITALNNAGNFQFFLVSNVPNGTTIVLATTPTVGFSPGGTNRVQLVRVRSVPNNANINGNVTATAWNGTTGGVIAIEVSGTLTILNNRRIDASGQGFTGGAVSGTSDGTAWCNWGDFRSPNITAQCYDGIYAQKGEGIAEDAGNNYGRGALANGGGGSGEHNGGGGGGSNVSSGGDGGMQFSACPYRRNGSGINCNTPAGGTLNPTACTASAVASTTSSMIGGIGGKSLTAGSSNNKIFMGGGGGGGQQNGAGGTSGGAGGGIVIISATTIVNNSSFTDAIRATGASAGATTGNEGAGGGGGGGTILLETNTFANAITLSVEGGDGGNAVTSNVSCRGPGGAGGGGLIWISGLTTTPTNLTTNVLSGGSGSVVCSSAAACGGTPPATNTLDCHGNVLYCATTPTSNGTVNTSLNIPLPIELIDLNSSCIGEITTITWKVAMEKNLDYYTLQRSSDADSWTDIATIYPSNSNAFPKDYTIDDKYLNTKDVSYYRLKIVNSNSSFENSRIITNKCKTNTSLDFTAWYNNGFIIEFKTVPEKVTIYNAIGQYITSLKLNENSTKSQYIPLESELPSGIYIVTSEYPNQVISKKLVINK